MRCVVVRYDHPVDRTVALGLIYGRGSGQAHRLGSDDCEGKRNEGGFGDPTVFTHPLSPMPPSVLITLPS